MSNSRSRRSIAKKAASQTHNKDDAYTNGSTSSTPTSRSGFNIGKMHQTSLVGFVKPVSSKDDKTSMSGRGKAKRRSSGGDTTEWLYEENMNTGTGDTGSTKADFGFNVEIQMDQNSPTISPFSRNSARSLILESSTSSKPVSSPVPGLSLFRAKRLDDNASRTDSPIADSTPRQLRKRKVREWEDSVVDAVGNPPPAVLHLTPSHRPNLPKRPRQTFVTTSHSVSPRNITAPSTNFPQPIPKHPIGDCLRGATKVDERDTSTSPNLGFTRLFDDVVDESYPPDDTYRSELAAPDRPLPSPPKAVRENSSTKRNGTCSPVTRNDSRIQRGEIVNLGETGPLLHFENIEECGPNNKEPNVPAGSRHNRRVIQKRRTRENLEAFLATISPDHSLPTGASRSLNRSSTSGMINATPLIRQNSAPQVQKIRRPGRHSYPVLNAHSSYEESREPNASQEERKNPFAIPAPDIAEVTRCSRVPKETVSSEPSTASEQPVAVTGSFDRSSHKMPDTLPEQSSPPCVLSSQPLDDGPFWETQPLLDIDHPLPTLSPTPSPPASKSISSIYFSRKLPINPQEKKEHPARPVSVQNAHLRSLTGHDDEERKAGPRPKDGQDLDITLVAESSLSTSSSGLKPLNSSFVGSTQNGRPIMGRTPHAEADVTLVAHATEIISQPLEKQRQCDTSLTPDHKRTPTGADIGALVSAVENMSPYKKRPKVLSVENTTEEVIEVSSDSDTTERDYHEVPPSTVVANSGTSVIDWFSKYSPSIFESQLPEEEEIEVMSLPPGWDAFKTPRKSRHSKQQLTTSRAGISDALTKRPVHASGGSSTKSTTTISDEYGADDAFGTEVTPGRKEEDWPEALRRFEQQPSPFAGMFSGNATSSDEESG
ncbi:hypothetical protein FRC20_004203 [Serendipita sp. 405]|nr:hypothetical protein FRC20_004203 [Serendipita sp. 405]